MVVLAAANRRLSLAAAQKLISGVIQGQTEAKAMLSVFSLATNSRRRLNSTPVESREHDSQAVEPSTGQQGHSGSMIDRPDVIRAVAIVMLLINFISLAGFWRLHNRKTDETLRGPLRFITDVNSAPASELSLLPGIGYELADRIVEDREIMGPYQSIDDLRRVRGIGPKTIEQIKSMVSLDSEAQEP
jgi:competence ComEA-like helix-hairpin-helix protein